MSNLQNQFENVLPENRLLVFDFVIDLLHKAEARAARKLQEVSRPERLPEIDDILGFVQLNILVVKARKELAINPNAKIEYIWSSVEEFLSQ